MTNSNKAKKAAAARAAKKAAAAARGDASPATPTMDPPFGLTGAEGDERVGVPEEIEVIERMRDLANRRITPADVAKQLNKEGLLARGHDWDARAVIRVLKAGYPAEGAERAAKNAAPFRGRGGR